MSLLKDVIFEDPEDLQEMEKIPKRYSAVTKPESAQSSLENLDQTRTSLTNRRKQSLAKTMGRRSSFIADLAPRKIELPDINSNRLATQIRAVSTSSPGSQILGARLGTTSSGAPFSPGSTSSIIGRRKSPNIQEQKQGLKHREKSGSLQLRFTDESDLNLKTNMNSNNFSMFNTHPFEGDQTNEVIKAAPPSTDFETFLAQMNQASKKAESKRTALAEFRDNLNVADFPGIAVEELYYYIEVLQINEQFSFFDINGDGSISEEELTEAMKNLDIDISPEDCAAMINRVDVDGDGDVSIEEFIKLMVGIRKKKNFLTNDAQIKEAFHLVDYDGDGTIGVEDIYNLFFELGEIVSVEEAKEILHMASLEVEGGFQYENFKGLMKEEDALI